ncbi:hypothetical protein PIROE2DRAFT_11679, partial [Piromyces sp. E2]
IPCNDTVDCPLYSYRCRKFKNNKVCDFTFQCNNQFGCVALNQKIDDSFYNSDGLYINSNFTANSPINNSTNLLFMFTNKDDFKDKTCKSNSECFSKLCKEGECVVNDEDPILIYNLISDEDIKPKINHGKALKEKCEYKSDCITKVCYEKRCEIKIDDNYYFVSIFVIGYIFFTSIFIIICVPICKRVCKKRRYYS